MENLPVAIRNFLEVVEMEADECVSISISNDGEMHQVAELLRKIKTHAKDLNEKRLEITRPIDESKSRVMSMFRPIEDKLKNAENIIKRGILAWEAKIAEENRRLQAEADKAAREAEERARAALVVKAETAIAEGKPELAVAYVEKAEAVVVAPVNVAVERRASGISIPKIWKYRIVDPKLIPDEFWILDEAKIGKVVKAMKATTNIPGIEAFEEATVSAKSF